MKITVICGGRSTEHAISLVSAKSVAQNLLAMQHEVQLVQISKQGRWSFYADANEWLEDKNSSELAVCADLSATVPSWLIGGKQIEAGVVFPVLHGMYGEDGSIQGLLDIMNAPYVTSSILGSAVTMNKVVCKQLLADAGVDVVAYKYFNSNDVLSYAQCAADLGETLFVKAASGGSSIGVEKVSNDAEYDAALEKIFKIDSEILVEAAVSGRELECAVLFNGDYKASVIGEIACDQGFYDFDAKYKTDAAKLQVPAHIDPSLQSDLQTIAIKACAALRIDGFARVDFFVCDNRIYINEINSIPGFTDISLFPRMFAASELDYPALLQELIESSLRRHKQKNTLLENVYE
jgi:D-alanine-D-alanine ligase